LNFKWRLRAQTSWLARVETCSQEEHSLHTGGVACSIHAAPTIDPKKFNALAARCFVQLGTERHTKAELGTRRRGKSVDSVHRVFAGFQGISSGRFLPVAVGHRRITAMTDVTPRQCRWCGRNFVPKSRRGPNKKSAAPACRFRKLYPLGLALKEEHGMIARR
jgi:hypothetical protein